MLKVKQVCKTCKSENVAIDAWASWDEELQQWVLGSTFDYQHCNDCDGETTIIEEPIEETQENIS